MPPKKANAPNKKTQEKVKQKVVEDRTFGLKNKKGKKQQTYIKTVQQQVQGNKKQNTEETENKLSKREQEKKKLEELNELFKPVQQAQKVEFGVDPKSVLCQYFKQGTCQKGNKCKFSHDLTIERKSEKKSIYTDERDDGNKETMNDWDQETLENVVNKRHGDSNTNKTNIVCKYFLEAIEKGLYGWFWNCPNGDTCMYRHALPPGFVLKKDLKRMEDEEEKISLEELIERERNQLSGDLTPVTVETFVAWKKRKIEEKKEKLNKELSQKKEAFAAGKSFKISGKEVFLFKPELADADDDEADDQLSYRSIGDEDNEQNGPCTEINLEAFANDLSLPANQGNSNITRVGVLTPKDREMAAVPLSKSFEDSDETSKTDMNGLGEASGGTGRKDLSSGNVEIDESLFDDIDELDIDDD